MTRPAPPLALALALPLALAMALAMCGAAPAEAQDEPPEGIANPLALTLDDLGAALSRPLFSPSRRPPQPPPRIAPRRAPVDDTPDLQLMGVMEIEGRSIAIVQDLGADDTRSLELDEAVGNWTVEAITASSLTLSDGNRTLRLQLFKPDGRR